MCQRISRHSHLVLFLFDLTLVHTGLYVAIENHFDPHGLLIKYGLLSGMLVRTITFLVFQCCPFLKQYLHADQQVKDDADPKERGWFTNLLTGPSSSIALAFLCNKALLPVRAPVTVGLTPMVARY